jgi:hypothetical protein
MMAGCQSTPQSHAHLIRSQAAFLCCGPQLTMVVVRQQSFLRGFQDHCLEMKLNLNTSAAACAALRSAAAHAALQLPS